MATSARHVVGLQDPPKNTSGTPPSCDGFSSGVSKRFVLVSLLSMLVVKCGQLLVLS